MTDNRLTIRNQQVLYDKKWKKFLGKAWLFRYIPFVEFAIAAGSMASGNVKETSDFDVIIGVREGRIFTARFFAILGFGFFGFRRKRLSHKEDAADKICLNHFITKPSYMLKPPYTDSWRELYRNLVPVWGDQVKINEFLMANESWAGPVAVFKDDLRYDRRDDSWVKKIREFFLGGRFGDAVERMLKFVQVRKIEYTLASSKLGFKPRVSYSDSELEFHPDRRKFENGH